MTRAIFYILLIPFVARASQCDFDLVMTTLSGRTPFKIAGVERWAHSHNLRLEIFRDKKREQVFEGTSFDPKTSNLKISDGIYALTLEAEGAHGEIFPHPLHPRLRNALTLFLVNNASDSGFGSSFFRSLWGLPIDRREAEFEIFDERAELGLSETISPGELVLLHDDKTRSPALFLLYLGHGRYLTIFAGKTGLLVSDLDSFKKAVGVEKVFRFPKAPILGSSDSELQASNWTTYGKGWARNCRFFLRRTREGDDRTIADQWLEQERRGHTGVPTAKKLRFIFAGAGKVRPPTFADHFSGYEALLEPWVRSGELDPAHDIIYPGRAFHNWEGKELLLRYPLEPPPGYFEIDPTKLPNGVSGRMLLAGLAPMSVLRGWHDSRHFEGFAAFPIRYMKPLRRLVRIMADKNLPISKDDRMERVFHAYEFLSLVPNKNRGALLPLLSVPMQSDSDDLTTVSALSQYLSKRDLARQIIPHAKRLLDEYDMLVENYGGGGRDPALDWRGSSIQARETIFGIAARLKLWINHFENRHLETRDPFEAAVLKKIGSVQQALAWQLARFEVALKESTRVSLEDYFAEIASPATDPNSKIYRFFVSSGICDDTDAGLVLPEQAPGSLAQSLQPARRARP